MKRTTIAINEDVIQYLNKYGKYGDTPNDVILRAFKENEQLKQSNKRTEQDIVIIAKDKIQKRAIEKVKQKGRRRKPTTEQEDIEKCQ